MPIYEYQCQSCGHEFEALQKLSDAVLTDCPACADATLKKKISAVAFRLKGGGWYETDFKSGDKKNLAGDSDKSTGDKGESGQTSGEGKAKEAKTGESKAGDKQAGEKKAGDKKADTKSSKPAGGS